MDKVTAITKKEQFKTIVTSATNSLIVDEPVDLGGQDLGFSPQELLAAALASCTSITLRMYANHKKWDVEDIKVDVSLEIDSKEKHTVFQREIFVSGRLDEAQRGRMLSIADACPLHKILMNTVTIHSDLIVEETA